MEISSHDVFTRPVRFRSRGTNEFLKKRWPRRPGKTPYRTTQLWPTILILTFHDFQPLMSVFFLSFSLFWTWERTASSGFHCHDNETNYTYSFYRSVSYKSCPCFRRNNTTIHTSWKRRRFQFVGCQDSWRASFDWQGEMIFTLPRQ